VSARWRLVIRGDGAELRTAPASERKMRAAFLELEPEPCNVVLLQRRESGAWVTVDRKGLALRR
jgi:hypothetical protein